MAVGCRRPIPPFTSGGTAPPDQHAKPTAVEAAPEKRPVNARASPVTGSTDPTGRPCSPGSARCPPTNRLRRVRNTVSADRFDYGVEMTGSDTPAVWPPHRTSPSRSAQTVLRRIVRINAWTARTSLRKARSDGARRRPQQLVPSVAMTIPRQSSLVWFEIEATVWARFALKAPIPAWSWWRTGMMKVTKVILEAAEATRETDGLPSSSHWSKRASPLIVPNTCLCSREETAREESLVPGNHRAPSTRHLVPNPQ